MSYICLAVEKEREYESNHNRKSGMYLVISILQVLLVGTFILLNTNSDI